MPAISFRAPPPRGAPPPAMEAARAELLCGAAPAPTPAPTWHPSPMPRPVELLHGGVLLQLSAAPSSTTSSAPSSQRIELLHHGGLLHAYAAASVFRWGPSGQGWISGGPSRWSRYWNWTVLEAEALVVCLHIDVCLNAIRICLDLERIMVFPDGFHLLLVALRQKGFEFFSGYRELIFIVLQPLLTNGHSNNVSSCLSLFSGTCTFLLGRYWLVVKGKGTEGRAVTVNAHCWVMECHGDLQ